MNTMLSSFVEYMSDLYLLHTYYHASTQAPTRQFCACDGCAAACRNLAAHVGHAPYTTPERKLGDYAHCIQAADGHYVRMDCSMYLLGRY